MTDPIPLPPTPTPKPVKERAEQDQAMLDRIVGIGQTLATAQADVEIMALLAPRGFDAAKFAEGLALQQAAQGTFSVRQTAIKTQGQISAVRSGTESAAREMYGEFRVNARRLFTAPTDRTALNLNGSIPRDTQQFIGAAQLSYKAAQKDPYAATFAASGYPAAYLTSALAAVDAFKNADQDQNAAIGAATKSTADRDAAFAVLDKWQKIFERLARTTLKNRPDLLKKLNL
jgi:hypothetical protein